MTLKNIIEIIRTNKMPFLYLYIKQDFMNKYAIGSFNCSICLPEDTDETRLEKAILWLTNYVKNFGSNSFILIIKSSHTASSSGVLGPFEFHTRPPQKEDRKINGLSGLSGLQFNEQNIRQLGYVSQAEVELRLIEKQVEFDKERQKMAIETVKEDYNFKLSQIRDTSAKFEPKAITELIREAIEAFVMFTGKGGGSQLAGVQQEQETEVLDPKEMMIKNIAESYKELSLSEIQTITNMNVNFITKLRENKQKNNQTDANTTFE